MAKPDRNSVPASVQQSTRTFFVTSSTIQGRNLLQSTRMAELFIDVLPTYTSQNKFRVHEFVVMPNHVHLLITIDNSMSIEKAMQLIKGNFSYRAKKELGVKHEIWQRGFSENRVYEQESYAEFRSYINNNPVKAGLAKVAEEYPFARLICASKKPQGLKPRTFCAYGTSKTRALILVFYTQRSSKLYTGSIFFYMDSFVRFQYFSRCSLPAPNSPVHGSIFSARISRLTGKIQCLGNRRGQLS